jgi:hypothetical protein
MGICFVRIGTIRRHWSAIVASIAFVVIAFALGCGGGGGTGGGITVPGTPTGNYTGLTVTVTINGITQSINNLSVNVE